MSHYYSYRATYVSPEWRKREQGLCWTFFTLKGFRMISGTVSLELKSLTTEKQDELSRNWIRHGCQEVTVQMEFYIFNPIHITWPSRKRLLCTAPDTEERRLDNPSRHSGRTQPATCYPLLDTFRRHILPHPLQLITCTLFTFIFYFSLFLKYKSRLVGLNLRLVSWI